MKRLVPGMTNEMAQRMMEHYGYTLDELRKYAPLAVFNLPWKPRRRVYFSLNVYSAPFILLAALLGFGVSAPLGLAALVLAQLIDWKTYLDHTYSLYFSSHGDWRLDKAAFLKD